jgi:hypothetical protein
MHSRAPSRWRTYPHILTGNALCLSLPLYEVCRGPIKFGRVKLLIKRRRDTKHLFVGGELAPRDDAIGCSRTECNFISDPVVVGCRCTR